MISYFTIIPNPSINGIKLANLCAGITEVYNWADINICHNNAVEIWTQLEHIPLYQWLYYKRSHWSFVWGHCELLTMKLTYMLAFLPYKIKALYGIKDFPNSKQKIRTSCTNPLPLSHVSLVLQFEYEMLVPRRKERNPV